MMTSLELPEALMRRVNAIANLAGKSSKVVMVEMIAEYANRLEKRQDCIQITLEAKKFNNEF